jgi:hypothetical protein
MAINYPGSLDNFTNPTSASPINSPSHADQHSNANDAIEALEAKVGANNSAITTSHDYKIAQLESLVTSAVSGAKSIYQDVRNQSGSNFVKATPVYVSGSEGSSGKMLISAASNASESTSSKTMGLTTSAISNNSNGQVISEGILEGIDTTGAVDGDPVWLGVNGAKIYGLLNKPSAPAHLVFLGIVIRGGQANTGSMYVKIQNGFELQELHNVEISSLLNGNILAYDSSTSTWKNTNTLQSTSSTVPLVIKGSTSQTANLQEWQDNTGTVKALVGSGGNAVFNGIRSGSGSTTAAINAYTTAAQIGILVKGAVSQTASLQEWQDSTGAINASLTSTGDFRISNIYAITSFNNAQLNMLSTGPRFTTNVTTNVTLTVKGVASQTANLQEWQNSAGGVVSSISNAGLATFSNLGVTNNINAYYGKISANTQALGYLGQLSAITANASTIGLVLRGFASQTANLQEWQNSSGTVLAKVDATGVGRFPYIRVGSTLDGLYSASISNLDPSLVGLAIRGAASQNTSLQEWQNNSGTTLARVNQFGDFYITGGRIFRGNQDLGANLNILNESDLKGIVVKAVSGQTKNLTELQSSTGAVLSGSNPIGQLFIRSTTPITASAVSQAITSVSFTSTTATYTFSATEQTISIGEYVTVFGITPSGYNGTYQVTAIDTVTAGSSYSFTVANTTNDTVTVGTGYFFPSASISISTQNKAHTGLIIKAVSGQTSSVMEIQNSLGQPTTWWDSVGGMTASRAVVSTLYSGGLMNTGTLGYFNATTFSASVTPIVVRGAASQTADLQQWQNSSGTVLAKIISTGGATLAGSTWAQGGLRVQGNYGGSNTMDIVNNQNIIGLTIKGNSTQTANLQEWQNSSGTVLGSLSANGQLYVYENTAGASGNALDINQGSGSRRMVFGSGGLNVGSTASVGSATWNALAQFEVYPAVASRIGIVIKGAASQIADLQQWQDSAGTALAGIGPNGRIYAQGKTGNTDDLLYLRRADNNIYMYVDKDATLRGNFGIRINQEPPIDTQAFMWSGTASRSALGVSGTGSTNPTFYAKATASQTSNLTEWQDSSGTALSYIKSDGSLNFIANSNSVLISGTSTSGFNRIISNGNDLSFSPYFDGLFAPANSAGRWRPANDATSDLGSSGQRWKDLYATSGILTNNSISKVGLIVKAIASQTANLQEWQDSAGTVLLSVGSSGRLLASARVGINDSSYTGTFNVTSFTAGAPIAILKGAASQTANLQEWQNSSGIVLASISAFGRLNSTYKASFSNSNFTITPVVEIISTGTGANSQGLIVKGASGQTANLQEWQDSSGAVLSKVDKDGNITAADLTLSGNLTVNGTTTNLNSVNLVIEDKNIIIADVATPTDTTADGAGITIKGATDKTFNWVQSTGRFTSSEPIQSSAFVSTYVYASQVGSTVIGSATLNTNSDTGGLLINTAGAANKGLTIRGAASQTANLQQWQDSNGSVLSRVQADGTFVWGSASSALQNSSGRLIVNLGSATSVGVTVKGFTSQTANLQEWQNSDAVSVAQISATGTVTIRPVGFSGNLNTAIISVTDRASTWTPGNFAFRSDSNGTPRFSFTAPNAPSEALTINGNYVGVQTPSPTSVFQVTSNGAGNTVSIIKGAVSQTANLQEWQNSAGYAGTAIDSGGSFYAPGIYSSYLMQATAGGAAVVPLTVKGVTSQTANLTEWKDSAGNAQAYVRYDGFINTNSSIRIAGDNLSVYRFQGVSDGNYTMNFPGSGNIQLFSATDSLGGGSKVLGISNATTVPSSNPTGGGILYVSSGSLVYRGAGGAITTIARSGNESSTISANTATTVDTVALSSFTTIEYTISIKQGSKVRSSKVLVHTDGTSIDSTEYGIMEMGGGITGILVTASVSSTNSILQVTITDAATTNATVKLIKTML